MIDKKEIIDICPECTSKMILETDIVANKIYWKCYACGFESLKAEYDVKNDNYTVRYKKAKKILENIKNVNESEIDEDLDDYISKPPEIFFEENRNNRFIAELRFNNKIVKQIPVYNFSADSRYFYLTILDSKKINMSNIIETLLDFSNLDEKGQIILMSNENKDFEISIKSIEIIKIEYDRIDEELTVVCCF